MIEGIVATEGAAGAAFNYAYGSFAQVAAGTAPSAPAGGSGTQKIDPNLKEAYTRESAAWAERQVAKVGLRAGFVWRGAACYLGARAVAAAHPTLHPGHAYPAHVSGKVCVQREPKLLVRFVGQAPIGATVYALKRPRCHLCATVVRAPTLQGVGEAYCDETTGAMIAQLKYGSGDPFHPLAQLQANIGIPLPPSTQWEIVASGATRIAPILPEPIRHAAQGRSSTTTTRT